MPSALILDKHKLPGNFETGHVTIEGQLDFQQKLTFYCPFFMRRHIKTHFHHNLIPQKNRTNLMDYQLVTIQRKLYNNPAYLKFTKRAEHLSFGGSNVNEILVHISVDVNEIGARYHKTFWQKCQQIWMEYLSLLCVFVVIVDRVMGYMFGRQIIRAWEVIPWKKLY